MENIKNGREYLQYVLKCLNDRLAQADAAILEGEKEIEDMHEYYWENYTEMDQYGYEDYDNQQALFRQMNANEEQFRLRKRFKKMQDSPCFGRVDFLIFINLLMFQRELSPRKDPVRFQPSHPAGLCHIF